ncbi:MAG: hypothetical protein A2750_02970 [Candidatus Yanofskybacteria bacterium RIFCSPHIGHO2_01_FULL_45_42]|uniref:Uncharacterized protein n=1 Tax=Candidatus Yanofskybacteria bacterium RIFCSPHIGHO2_01_FULL_45_42 TaxID=1802671 RepID=A0A1F8F2H2_9BACT|nr:MAG: hypothetical protein A2750_02970 [Candidatus Yanofskybacteria bacterium RIFCSPHIGHO2_01_FULL_45_42]
MRTGGRSEHNCIIGGTFRKAKYEIRRRRKIPFCPPERKLSKFSVRIFVKKSSDFNQKAPPIFRIRILGDCCLALATLGLGRNEDFEGIFEVAKQFLPAQTEVRFAEGKHKFKNLSTNLFSFAFGERQSDNLILTAQTI